METQHSLVGVRPPRPPGLWRALLFGILRLLWRFSGACVSALTELGGGVRGFLGPGTEVRAL